MCVYDVSLRAQRRRRLFSFSAQKQREVVDTLFERFVTKTLNGIFVFSGRHLDMSRHRET